MIRAGVGFTGLLLVSATCPFASAVLARDHGVMGQTWGIVEPDLLTTIDTKLRTMQANGGIARMQQALVARTEERVHNPVPVSGIEPAREARSWTFDPSIVVQNDIRDTKGNIIARA
ncbi:MAG: type-F conjugative transfer system protein TraW, partial [Pseudomonadota bacterium]|nr:type-F conjugative transfer system protein TraW [Pseudomonadota bacterium]